MALKRFSSLPVIPRLSIVAGVLLLSCSTTSGSDPKAEESPMTHESVSQPEPVVLFSFDEPESQDKWLAVNDGVMGGVSQGGLEVTGDGIAVFKGVVSLENNGGFASVRTSPGDWDLSPYQGIALRLRGDGKKYSFRLRTDRRFDGVSYSQTFEAPGSEWQTLLLPFSRFEPTWRGRPVPGAPPLDPAGIQGFGILISDKQEGPFRLEVEWIGAVKSLPEAPDPAGAGPSLPDSP